MDDYINMLNAYFKIFEPIINPQYKGEALDVHQIISGKDKTSNNINGYITEIQREHKYTVNGIELGTGTDMFAALLVGTFKLIN